MSLSDGGPGESLRMCPLRFWLESVGREPSEPRFSPVTACPEQDWRARGSSFPVSLSLVWPDPQRLHTCSDQGFWPQGLAGLWPQRTARRGTRAALETRGGVRHHRVSVLGGLCPSMEFHAFSSRLLRNLINNHVFLLTLAAAKLSHTELIPRRVQGPVSPGRLVIPSATRSHGYLA